MIPCKVAATRCGWLVTFPSNARAALLLEGTERSTFARDCGVDLDDDDLLLALDLGEISQCSIEWYEQAVIFRECPFD